MSDKLLMAIKAAMLPYYGKRLPSLEADAYDLCYSGIVAHDIKSPLQVQHFFAQVAHESGGFKYRKEVWGPTEAQLGYEGRLDLGNTRPGDGKRYLGRGLIQLTGRANYTLFSKESGLNVIDTPEKLESGPPAAFVAGWYWKKHGLNALADNDDIVKITKKINGGLNGLVDRKEKLAACRVFLSGPFY